jgi:chemotaxis protein methyltransferase CheR
MQRRYFSPHREEWQISEEIRNMVLFRRGNLATDRFPDSAAELHDMDLILCRNTFIYFSPSIIASVVEKFADTLADDGYLMTGHGELRLQNLVRFKLRLMDEQVVFQKRRPGDAEQVKIRGTAETWLPKSPSPLVRPVVIPRPAGRMDKARMSATENPKQSPSSLPNLLAEAQAALVQAELKTAISKAQAVVAAQPENTAALMILACAHADRGEYQQAGHFCLRTLEGAPTDPSVHLLLAHLAEATGDLVTAREALEKTLYLDPVRVAALVELGSLCSRAGQAGKAAILFRAARDLLGNLPQEAEVPDFQGMTAGELRRHLDELIGAPPLRH